MTLVTKIVASTLFGTIKRSKNWQQFDIGRISKEERFCNKVLVILGFTDKATDF